ncbi:MAG TPA: hypothetical protein VEA59_00505 [Patescibacteria group bacterium]|nr:hypothetical protein [Patescibacteria group bacterium]
MNIEKLLQQKHIGAVVVFLLLSPKRSFSVKEISQKLSLDKRIVLQVLEELKRLGIVGTVTRDGVRLYMYNPREYSDIAVLEEFLRNRYSLEDSFSHDARKAGFVAGYLTGLFVGRPSGRVDVLLVGDIPRATYERLLDKWQDLLETEFNYCVMGSQEFELRKAAFDRFINDILDEPHISLV